MFCSCVHRRVRTWTRPSWWWPGSSWLATAITSSSTAAWRLTARLGCSSGPTLDLSMTSQAPTRQWSGRRAADQRDQENWSWSQDIFLCGSQISHWFQSISGNCLFSYSLEGISWLWGTTCGASMMSNVSALLRSGERRRPENCEWPYFGDVLSGYCIWMSRVCFLCLVILEMTTGMTSDYRKNYSF